MVESSDSDDLLVKKKVQWDDDSDAEPRKRKEVKKEAKLVTDKELLARFYGQDSDLNASEKFLRNYILNEGWKDTGAMRLTKDKEILDMVKSEASGASVFFKKSDVAPLGDSKVDDEDAARENEMDVYEQKYNFRFEDPNAATITSHARDAGVEESLRRPDDTRKQARERAKDRKDDLKRKKKEEIT